MDEEEHEVYGGEIPDEGEMEGDVDAHHGDVDMSNADDDAVKVFPPYHSSCRCLYLFKPGKRDRNLNKTQVISICAWYAVVP